MSDLHDVGHVPGNRPRRRATTHIQFFRYYADQNSGIIGNAVLEGSNELGSPYSSFSNVNFPLLGPAAAASAALCLFATRASVDLGKYDKLIISAGIRSADFRFYSENDTLLKDLTFV